ncbi:MAG: MBL fold metallo-hydrolase [Candidatus Bathyarchaeia archaeon]
MFKIGEAEGVEIDILSDNEVDFDFANRVRFSLAEHGFSTIIKVRTKTSMINILFDAGTSGDVVLKNAELAEIDLEDVDYIILSHRHYDHVGGLLKIIDNVNLRVPIICHPKIFEPSLAIKPFLRNVGPPFTSKQLSDKIASLLTTISPMKIAEGIITSGEIPRVTEYEKTEDFYAFDEKFHIVQDRLMDDSALIINVKDVGLVVVTGCGHSGLINTLRHSLEITGVKRIYAVIGGFHLLKSTRDVLERTFKDLLEIGVEKIAPTHCSGIAIKALVLQRKPEMYLGAGVGSKILIGNP